MEKISIKNGETTKVVSIHITEAELIEAFQKASRKLMDEFKEKGGNPIGIMMDGLRDVLVCHELVDILFAADEAADDSGKEDKSDAQN